MKDIKWHIWNNSKKELLLCWNETVLEFDSQEAAIRFLESVRSLGDDEEIDYSQAIIIESVLYWDRGYLNATNLKVVSDKKTHEHILMTVGDKS